MIKTSPQAIASIIASPAKGTQVTEPHTGTVWEFDGADWVVPPPPSPCGVVFDGDDLPCVLDRGHGGLWHRDQNGAPWGVDRPENHKPGEGEASKPAAHPRSLRPEVQSFALAMETKLRANEHKGSWSDCEAEELLLRAYEELGELHREVIRRFKVGAGQPHRDHAQRIREEAADVANMVMMVASVCGALRG